MEVLHYLTVIITLVATALMLKRDLMMFQQNSYRRDRYARYLRASGDSTSYLRLAGIIAVFLAAVRFASDNAKYLMLAVIFAWVAIYLATRKYKKPLVFTSRARRIIGVALVLTVVFAVVLSWLTDWNCLVAAVSLGLVYVLSPYVLLKANFILKPVESRITRRYYDEAASILADMPDLTVVGITGSYGKTSTKHYLHRILSEQYEVVMTPGNFNTTLGVVRTVREHLKPYHKIFLCEMGAKQPGDIREICELVHPKIGVITAVGPQHLESFKTIECVQATKFELVDALPADGLAVLNDDFPFIANRKVEGVETQRYAVEASHPANYHAEDIRYSAEGTYFTIVAADGRRLELHTRLVGSCNVSNLIAAVIVALHLGVTEANIKYAVEHIEQVEHRLSIKRTAAGVTIIDDAYNSNPVGSKMALEVLSGMTGGRRIIVTPGMIELGDDQEMLNADFGASMAGNVDIAIIVGRYNREAITAGLTLTEISEDDIYTVDTFAQAQTLLQTIIKPGDTVLYENDLPDTFK